MPFISVHYIYLFIKEHATYDIHKTYKIQMAGTSFANYSGHMKPYRELNDRVSLK